MIRDLKGIAGVPGSQQRRVADNRAKIVTELAASRLYGTDGWDRDRLKANVWPRTGER
jgi:hypothetical protein